MADLLRVSSVHFIAAPSSLRATGLVGWANVVVNDGLELVGLGVRRTRDGRTILTFPERRDGGGRTHAVVRATSIGVRNEIQEQILNELRRAGVLA